MSYEGTVFQLCEKGHVSECDAHFDYLEVCSCGASFTDSFEIDETNGSPHFSDVDVVLLTPDVLEACNLGHKHIVQYATYKFEHVEPYLWAGNSAYPSKDDQ